MKGLIIIIALGMLLSCQQGAQQASEELPTDKLEEGLIEVMATHELMGMSVVLLKEGEVFFEGSFGLANLEREIPVTLNTVYRIASISKTLTAIALLQLVDERKVDLSTDVSEYLGWELRNPAHPDVPITLDLLLSHRSSLRDGEGYRKFSGSMIKDKLNIKELFLTNGEFFTDDMYDERAPGEYFSYTNCSWGLIASIIELRSGQRFDEYCKQHIFEPLGMGSSFNVLDVEDLDQLAVLYRYKDSAWIAQADDYKGVRPESRAFEGYEIGQNGLIFGPQGSLRASAGDLVKLSQFFMSEGASVASEVLSQESISKMMDTHWSYDGTNGDTWEDFWWAYGYGMHHITNQDSADIIFPDRSMSGHPGIAYGLLSDMYVDPATGSGVVFITNGSKNKYDYGKSSTFYQVEEDIFQLLYPFLN